MLTRQDYNEVAQLHINSIDQGFLSTLGVRFLALMYHAMDEAETAILIIEKEDDKVVGFVSGGTGMGAIYKGMFKRFPALCMALAPTLFSPKKIWRIIEILRHKSDAATLPSWELFSIAVSADMRGGDVARRLYDRLKSTVQARGGDSFQITVGEQLLPAHKFYQKMGAKKRTTISVHGDAKSVIYVQNLNDAPS